MRVRNHSLGDILFDTPTFGQELDFLDDIFDAEQFYADEELGVIKGFAGAGGKVYSTVPAARASLSKKPIAPPATMQSHSVAKSAPVQARPAPAAASADMGSKYLALKEAENRIASQIADKVRGDLKPQLSAIQAMLDESALQTQATDEHRVINNTAAFRGRVLRDLYKIAANLPRNHPVRKKIASKLGLF